MKTHLRSILWPTLCTLVACAPPETSEGELGPSPHEYEASVRWTSYGVPHVLADDIPSAMYGQGWAYASLGGCVLADQIVRVRSERAAFFGPGEDNENIDSDFGVLALGVHGRAAAALAEQPEDVQAMIRAYATGYSDYVQLHADRMPCGSEPWLRPIEPEDLFAYYLDLATLGSGRNMVEMIATARPPVSSMVMGAEPSGAGGSRPEWADRLDQIPPLRERRPGSNGWAIGRERSASGGGMVVANPHFPWEGELKLYESHLTVPGQLDVYGTSLQGVLGVLIGFNEHVAWTHTFSDGQRFTMYALTLDPEDPTVYIHDGQAIPMEEQTYTIDVLQPDGTLASESRVLYRSRYGPILNVDPFGWQADMALTVRDANGDNDSLIHQFVEMNRAQSLDEFIAAHHEIAGIPWVNTIAASADGQTWYADSTPTPNLSDEAIAAWQERAEGGDFLTAVLAGMDVVLLDGSESMNDWVEEPGARMPGLVPSSAVPQLLREDFVFNSNDSHWLSNPLQPLTGYSPLHGFEATPRRPRTRMNARILMETGAGSASGEDGRFDRAELQQAILGNEGLLADMLLDDVIARCQGVGSVEAALEGEDPQSVDIGPACTVLAGWDRLLNVDSVGAVVWREMLGALGKDATFDRGSLWAEPFDPADPVGTPYGLAPAPEDGDDPILEALGQAVLTLERAGIPVDAPLGEAQYVPRDGQRIPMHGGNRLEGTANLIAWDHLNLITQLGPRIERGALVNETTHLSEDGYVVNFGSSFVMTMEFGAEGPVGEALLSYGQSEDPASPHHVDQTHMFAERQWRPMLYTSEQIEADSELRVEEIVGGPVAEPAEEQAE